MLNQYTFWLYPKNEQASYPEFHAFLNGFGTILGEHHYVFPDGPAICYTVEYRPPAERRVLEISLELRKTLKDGSRCTVGLLKSSE